MTADLDEAIFGSALRFISFLVMVCLQASYES